MLQAARMSTRTTNLLTGAGYVCIGSSAARVPQKGATTTCLSGVSGSDSIHQQLGCGMVQATDAGRGKRNDQGCAKELLKNCCGNRNPNHIIRPARTLQSGASLQLALVTGCRITVPQHAAG
jgi:hypothetical protein